MELLRQSEIQHFDLPVVIHDDVVGLEVTVCDAALMGGRNRVTTPLLFFPFPSWHVPQARRRPTTSWPPAFRRAFSTVVKNTRERFGLQSNAPGHEVSHKAVSNWLDIFERLYAIFRLSPFGAPKLGAVKKEQKQYHADWSVIPEKSIRFENLVAAHLLKWVHFQQDAKGRDLELQYFRDIDGREVDFVIVERRKSILFLECKWKDADVAKGLNYLKERFPACEAIQIHARGQKDYETPRGVRVMPSIDFLSTLV